MPVSTVVQALIGSITVRTGLLWWTVAMLARRDDVVWLAVLLYVKISQPDDGVVRNWWSAVACAHGSAR